MQTVAEAARQLGGPFCSPVDLAHRTGLEVKALTGLAASGALASVGVGRREGLWMAGALAEVGPRRLPLTPGLDPPRLGEMTPEESHRADLWATGVSRRHPIEFVRSRLDEEGCSSVATVLGRRRPGRVSVGGVVTHRQRPATAAGVVFLNLEDETGQLNVIVTPEVWQRHREVARRSAAMIVDGVVEHRQGVTNLLARELRPLGVYTIRSRDFR